VENLEKTDTPHWISEQSHRKRTRKKVLHPLIDPIPRKALKDAANQREASLSFGREERQPRGLGGNLSSSPLQNPRPSNSRDSWDFDIEDTRFREEGGIVFGEGQLLVRPMSKNRGKKGNKKMFTKKGRQHRITNLDQ
jgi:hypothetical protein